MRASVCRTSENTDPPSAEESCVSDPTLSSAAQNSGEESQEGGDTGTGTPSPFVVHHRARLFAAPTCFLSAEFIILDFRANCNETELQVFQCLHQSAPSLWV